MSALSEYLGDGALRSQFNDRELELLGIIITHGGSIEQHQLVEESSLSKSRVSYYVSELVEDGHLQKMPLVKRHLVYLPGCKPETLQSALGEAI